MHRNYIRQQLNPGKDKMGERLQPHQSLAYLHEGHAIPAWRSEGFSVAWGKFTKTRFTYL